MQIQAYLTAAVINLKRLAAAVIALILAVVHAHQRPVAHDRGPLLGLTPAAPAPPAAIFQVGFFNEPFRNLCDPQGL